MRSRIRREPSPGHIVLTERDRDIFLLLSRYRYLRSSHFHALIGGSEKHFGERLSTLFHGVISGGQHIYYLDRPRQQWQAYNARYMPAIYELDERGEAYLGQHRADAVSPLLHRGKGSGKLFWHELMVCDIIASIEIGVRQDSSLRFISWQELLRSAPESTRRAENPLKIPITFTYEGRAYTLPLVPDAMFGLEYDQDGRKSYRVFLLEADRASEPVKASILSRTSYRRKILQYRQLIGKEIYKQHFGLKCGMFLITVTTNAVHLKSIQAMVDEVTEGKGNNYLLFKSMPALNAIERAPEPSPSILIEPYHRVGREQFYINKL